jgi:hypothetical protein
MVGSHCWVSPYLLVFGEVLQGEQPLLCIKVQKYRVTSLTRSEKLCQGDPHSNKDTNRYLGPKIVNFTEFHLTTLNQDTSELRTVFVPRAYSIDRSYSDLPTDVVFKIKQPRA